ncbi:unnamed protein product [Amoebophrya sp. A120]|nr:unnamed protein product [Amoebophrya sp. A120]|eukprot:GSA120T00017627001.1
MAGAGAGMASTAPGAMNMGTMGPMGMASMAPMGGGMAASMAPGAYGASMSPAMASRMGATMPAFGEQPQQAFSPAAPLMDASLAAAFLQGQPPSPGSNRPPPITPGPVSPVRVKTLPGRGDLMNLLATFYPDEEEKLTERESVRVLVKNLVEKKASNHRFPLDWLSTVAKRQKPRAIREDELGQMNQLEDLYYHMKHDGKDGFKLDKNELLVEGSFHGFLPNDMVQVQRLDPDPADLNGCNVTLVGIKMNEQPCTVELLPQDDKHKHVGATGSLVRLNAYRLLTARCREELNMLETSQADVLFTHSGKIGRVESVGHGPYQPWRVRLAAVTAEEDDVVVEAFPILLSKWIDVGDFAHMANLASGDNTGITTFDFVNGGASTSQAGPTRVVQVLEQEVDEAGRDILTCIEVDAQDLMDEEGEDVDPAGAISESQLAFGAGATRVDQIEGTESKNKQPRQFGKSFKCFPGDLKYYPRVGSTVWVSSGTKNMTGKEQASSPGKKQRRPPANDDFLRGVVLAGYPGAYFQVQVTRDLVTAIKVIHLNQIERYDPSSDLEEPAVQEVHCLTTNLVNSLLNAGSFARVIGYEATEPALESKKVRVMREDPREPGVFFVTLPPESLTAALREQNNAMVWRVPDQHLDKIRDPKAKFLEGEKVKLKDIDGLEHRIARIKTLEDARHVWVKLQDGKILRDGLTTKNIIKAEQFVRELEELGPMERSKVFEAEAKELAALYDLQLQEISACQQLLLQDQERFSYLLASAQQRVRNKQGTVKPLYYENDEFEELLPVLKAGLDFRIQELVEDGRRIERTEERLRRKIFLAIQEYEVALLCSTGLVSNPVLLKRMRQQERVLNRQQEALDWLRFDRDLAADEAKRLRREACEPRNLPHIDTIAASTVEGFPIFTNSSAG